MNRYQLSAIKVRIHIASNTKDYNALRPQNRENNDNLERITRNADAQEEYERSTS